MRKVKKRIKIPEETKVAILDLFYNTMDNSIPVIAEQTNVKKTSVHHIIDQDLKKRQNENKNN